MLTQERLKELLHYNPETGIFIRRVRVSSKAPAGAVAGYVDPSHGYVSIGVDGREYYGHRLAFLYMTGEWPKKQADHKNTNRSDNRWDNLREATQAQNKTNLKLRSNNTSGYKGVTWDAKLSKWKAQIGYGGKHIYLGVFSDKEDAKKAYDISAAKLHGDFHNKNI